MSNKHPIFFDASGKRRRVVNFMLTVLGGTLFGLLGFTVYYLVLLGGINESALTEQIVLPPQQNRIALFYTDAHEDAYSIVSDQIQNLDTLILPKYLLTDLSIDTPKSYETVLEDLADISSNRLTNYSKYFALSSKNYGEQPTYRNRNFTTDRNVTNLVTSQEIDSIVIDLTLHGAKGLLIDVDLSSVNSPESLLSYTAWNDSIAEALHGSNLELGYNISANMINEFNTEFFQQADFLYATLDNTPDYDNQMDAIYEVTNALDIEIFFELPTVSVKENLAEDAQFELDIDYAEAQHILFEKQSVIVLCSQ